MSDCMMCEGDFDFCQCDLDECRERIEKERDALKAENRRLKYEVDHYEKESLGFYCDRERLKSQVEVLREALKILHDETVEYITINHLGDPHHNQSMKLAREALKKADEIGKE